MRCRFLEYACELQQMINVYSDASVRSLGSDGWVPVDLSGEIACAAVAPRRKHLPQPDPYFGCCGSSDG